MKTIRTIELSGSTRQERLPGFAEDFPYIASWAETGQYNGGMVALAPGSGAVLYVQRQPGV